MSHVLTITRIDAEDDGDIDYEIGGPHGGCSVWYPCEVELVSITVRAGLPGTPPLGRRYNKPMMSRRRDGKCPHVVTDDEEDAGEYGAHGEEHQYIDGEWMTDAGRCAAAEADVAEDIFDIARAHGVGSYDVEVDYWGDGQWNLIYVGPHDSTAHAEAVHA